MEEKDIYDEEEIDELLDSDEISLEEGGFMNGYLSDKRKTNKDNNA